MFTVTAEPVVSSRSMKTDNSILYISILYHEHRHRHKNTPRSISALTVTDPLADKTSHASGRAWYWGPPSSPGRTPRHIHKPHTQFIVGLKVHTHTHTPPTHISVRKSLHLCKCRHFLSLFLRFIPPSVSFSQQPHSQSDQRWHHSVAASAEAGLWMCVCVCVCEKGEKGRNTQTLQEY